MRAVVADGRSFLMRDNDRWDIILIDAYRGPFVPFHLLTKEFYTLVKSRLAPGGVVVQNIEPSTMLFDSATATLNSVFPSVDLYDGGGNVVAVGYDGPSMRQSDLVARATAMQAPLQSALRSAHHCGRPARAQPADRQDPDRRLCAGRNHARHRAEQRKVEGPNGSAPLMPPALLRGLLLFVIAIVLGFALMGFEMLASRYLYPYFGGGINTWASLIATVLIALMLGYLIGGALVDRTMSPRLCGALLIVAGVYLFSIPLWVDPLFAWMLRSVGDGMAGIILAATVLLLLPLTLMSVFTPFAVRLLLTSVSFGGRLVGYVYGVSTVGNVLGTLVTTFTLVPMFGSRALTMAFAAITALCGLVMILCAGSCAARRHDRAAASACCSPLSRPARRPSRPWLRPAPIPKVCFGTAAACISPRWAPTASASSRTARRANSGAIPAAGRPRSARSVRAASWSTAISASTSSK